MIEWVEVPKWDTFGASTFRATVGGVFKLRLVYNVHAATWTVDIDGHTLKRRPDNLDDAKKLATKALAARCRKALADIEEV